MPTQGTTHHIVAIVVFNGVVLGDFAMPSEVFARVQLEGGMYPYIVKICGLAKTVMTDHCTVVAPYTLAELQNADTIIVPGLADLDVDIPDALIHGIRKAHQRGARIASICSGAFILAATGLLHGLKATTHWLAAEELSRRYSGIEVDANVLYVDNGQLRTSAGAAAGLDLVLHMIRTDFGAAVAARAARIAVMPLERAGGQAQFIERRIPSANHGSLQPLLVWIENNLCSDLSVATLAEKGAMSIRSLHRRFVEQTGVTPARWVLNARIRCAQELLETTSLAVEQVSHESGFGSSATFRARFHGSVGTSPLVYRRTFRGQ
jgi:transcriptional regulator GlxA family with amidase domain